MDCAGIRRFNLASCSRSLETNAMMLAAKTLDYAVQIDEVQWVGTPSRQRPQAVVARPIAPHTATNLYSDAIGFSGEFASHFEKLRAIRTDQSLWPEGAQA